MTELAQQNIKFLEVTWLRVSKVWWSMFWRALVFGFLGGAIAGFIIGFFMAMVGAQKDTITLISQIAGFIIGIPIGMLVVKMVLKKQYSDFRIALVSK